MRRAVAAKSRPTYQAARVRCDLARRCDIASMRTAAVAFAAALIVHAMSPALAQKLPPPSRAVFKCEKDGKVVYTDSPCLGAQRVDVQPTRGLNKMSGTERIGADVRQERHDEAMAEALHPIFGETAEQRATRHRRAKLPQEARVQCGKLDGLISTAENEERRAAQASRQEVQKRLFGLRGQYKELKC